MIQRILPFLNQFIPTALAAKGLSKIDPRLSHFFSTAAAAGYGTDAALGFLRKKLGNPPSQEEQQRLEQGESQGTLRPDEAASLQRIRQSQRPLDVAQKGVAALAGLGAGALTIPRQPPQAPAAPQAPVNPESGPLQGVGPAVEQAKQRSDTFRKMGAYPEDLAREGQQQTVAGQPQPQQPQARTYDPLAGLSKYPELLKFIQSEIASGGNAQSISSKARKSAKLSDIVNSIENEIGEPFEALLGRLIGQQGEPQAQSQSFAQREMQNVEKQKARSPKQQEIIERIKNHIAKM